MARIQVAGWALNLAVAGVLGGCGHGADSARTEHQAHLQAHNATGQAAQAAAAATALDADLVSAVSGAGDVSPVGLKFRMREPPRVGQPLRMELVLAQDPGVEIDALLVSFQPSDGLRLESDRSVEFHSPQTGATQRLEVTLRPQQPGVLNLSATVLVDAGSTSLSRSFSIPLIAILPAP
jgi:hypothetical protein